MQRRRVFVDASALIAVINPKESAHSVAKTVLEDLVKNYGATLFTTNWVKNESLTHLKSLGDAHCKKLDDLITKGPFEVVQVDTRIEEAALARFWSVSDKNWSVVDCSSFVVMEDHGIVYALAADDDFRQAGKVPLLRQNLARKWEVSYTHLQF